MSCADSDSGRTASTTRRRSVIAADHTSTLQVAWRRSILLDFRCYLDVFESVHITELPKICHSVQKHLSQSVLKLHIECGLEHQLPILPSNRECLFNSKTISIKGEPDISSDLPHQKPCNLDASAMKKGVIPKSVNYNDLHNCSRSICLSEQPRPQF